MTTTTQPNGKKQTKNSVKWIVGVSLIIGGLIAFSSSFLAGLLILIAGLLIIPTISDKLKAKFPFWKKKSIRTITPIALFLIGLIMTFPNMPDGTTSENDNASSQKNSKSQGKSPYQSYLDVFKSIELTEEAKENRKLHLDGFEQNDYYKILIDSAIVSEEYIPIMQAISEGVTYSSVEGMAMTLNTHKKVQLLGDSAMAFTETAMIVGMPKYGGYTKEFIDVFERYRKKYGYYKEEAMAYYKDGIAQTVDPFDFSPIFAVLDPKNPKVLDALYEARKKGISLWGDCKECFYPYITSKQEYIAYIKQVYPKSPYIPKWEIEISASDLYAVYKANEVSADNQYKGKFIAVGGTIDNIGKDIFDNPYVSLKTGEYLQSVNCYFSDKNNNMIAQLSKGSRIVIVGKCDGFSILNVIMKNCEIEEIVD